MNLKEARRDGNLAQFAKQHQAEETQAGRFDALLGAMAKTTESADQAATRALSNALRDELSANRFAFRPNCGRARNQDHDEVPFSDLDFVGKGVW